MWKKLAIVVVIAIVVMYLMSPSSQLHTLKDKRVLVTGASGGIGEQIAYMYAKHGANLVVTARRQKELIKVADKCATLSPSQSAKFFAIAADMSLPQDTKRVIEESIKLMGGLDILVLNHVTEYKIVKYEGTQKRLDAFDFDMNVNFRSYVYLATHALKQLKATNGSIIVINALSGKVPLPGMLTYAAAKHALNGFFHSLLNEMRAFGSNVSVTNCIVGLTGTENVVSKMKQHGRESGIFLAPQSPENTAYDVVEAGARRVDRMFTPYFSGRLITMIHEIWPTPIEYLFTSILTSIQSLDS